MKNRLDLLSLGLILIAVIRIAAILPVLSATTDEPVHVAAGVELLQQHHYDLLPENPPLARLIFAAPLIAAGGVHFDPQADVHIYIGALFYARGHYRTNLVLARSGSVLFLLIAAMAVLAMLRHEIGPVRIAAIGLLVWHSIASLAAHPQYFAYFNEIAGRDPSRFLVDSNLDWGQDALLLQRELRRQKAESVGLALAGMHDYNRLGFPPNYRISPDAPAAGWVAVSDHMYRWGLRGGCWSWLRGRTYRRVGASIRLYYIR